MLIRFPPAPALKRRRHPHCCRGADGGNSGALGFGRERVEDVLHVLLLTGHIDVAHARRDRRPDNRLAPPGERRHAADDSRAVGEGFAERVRVVEPGRTPCSSSSATISRPVYPVAPYTAIRKSSVMPSKLGSAAEIPPRGEAIALGVGDVLLLPRAGGYAIADTPDTPDALDAPDAPTTVEVQVEDLQAISPLGRYENTGPGPTTDLVCGAYLLDRARPHPLLGDLPDLIRLPARASRHRSQSFDDIRNRLRPEVARNIAVVADRPSFTMAERHRDHNVRA
jgi:hypothetical protein